MTRSVPSQVIAVSMALSGFSIAVMAGLAASNPSTQILRRALICLFVCHLIGWILGTIGERAIRERVVQYAREHPIPRPDAIGSTTDARGEGEDVLVV